VKAWVKGAEAEKSRRLMAWIMVAIPVLLLCFGMGFLRVIFFFLGSLDTRGAFSSYTLASVRFNPVP